VEVINGKVEDEKVQARALAYGKVDTIISEPIGVMLYHERMVSGDVSRLTEWAAD
jgi:histone-arginine methyltransferase CARM1